MCRGFYVDGTLLIEAEMTDKCQLVHTKDGYIHSGFDKAMGMLTEVSQRGMDVYGGSVWYIAIVHLFVMDST